MTRRLLKATHQARAWRRSAGGGGHAAAHKLSVGHRGAGPSRRSTLFVLCINGAASIFNDAARAGGVQDVLAIAVRGLRFMRLQGSVLAVSRVCHTSALALVLAHLTHCDAPAVHPTHVAAGGNAPHANARSAADACCA